MQHWIDKLIQKDERALARVLSWVENQTSEAQKILPLLPLDYPSLVLGITGPPGAGKSTLTNALLGFLSQQSLRIGVIAVDPTSVFTQGAILGDRVRMAEFFMHPNIFIRSVATRGYLGGLCANIVEMIDVMRANQRDVIIIETVGVGQSEIEIATVADLTAVVLVPEAGDDIQAFKAGVMEIADLFVVNKSDRVGANLFVQNLVNMLHLRPAHSPEIPIVKTVASQSQGIEELWQAIKSVQTVKQSQIEHLAAIRFQKTLRLLHKILLQRLQTPQFIQELKQAVQSTTFNAYQWIERQWLEKP